MKKFTWAFSNRIISIIIPTIHSIFSYYIDTSIPIALSQLLYCILFLLEINLSTPCTGYILNSCTCRVSVCEKIIFSARERTERLVAGNFYGALRSAPLRSNITPRLSERSDQGRGNISLRFNESGRKIACGLCTGRSRTIISFWFFSFF